MKDQDNIITPLFSNTEDPAAARCRDAVKRACAAPTDRPQIVPCDAKGNAKIPAQGQTLNLTPFPDGVLFKMTQNSARPGSYLLHDAAGLVVALAMTQEIADILARGAHLFYVRAQEVIKAQEAADEMVEPYMPTQEEIDQATERTAAVEALPPAKSTSNSSTP
jgi:hypothetical protein